MRYLSRRGKPAAFSHIDRGGAGSPSIDPNPHLDGGWAAPTPPATETVPLCPQLQLIIEWQQVQSIGEVYNQMEASGQIDLSVNTAASPPTVRGEGELPITGQGQAGDCRLTWTGALVYQLDGEIAPGEDGGLEVHLTGERAGQMVAVGNECGGGGGAPFEGMDEVTFPYRDGATSEWTWSFPTGGVEGSATWTLRVPCSP